MYIHAWRANYDMVADFDGRKVNGSVVEYCVMTTKGFARFRKTSWPKSVKVTVALDSDKIPEDFANTKYFDLNSTRMKANPLFKKMSFLARKNNGQYGYTPYNTVEDFKNAEFIQFNRILEDDAADDAWHMITGSIFCKDNAEEQNYVTPDTIRKQIVAEEMAKVDSTWGMF